MRKVLLWTFIGVVSPGTSPASAKPLVDPLSLDHAGMTKYWALRLPLVSRDTVADAFLVDEVLYVTTVGGMLYSVTAREGLIRWVEKVTGRGYPIFRPSHIVNGRGTGPVVLLASSQLAVLDRYTGQFLKRFQPGFIPKSSVVGMENAVYLGSVNGRFYSLWWNTPTGIDPIQQWEVLVDGPVTAAPLLHGEGKLLFASEGGTVHSCVASDKTWLWSARVDGMIVGDPAVDDRGVYVPSLDRSLYKLDLARGTLLWRYRSPNPLRRGPVVAGHTVYQPCSDYGLIAIDADTGREKWHRPAGITLAARMPEGDVVFTKGAELEVVNPQSGEVIHTISTNHAKRAVPNHQSDAVYLWTDDGRLLCIRPSGVANLRPLQVNLARRQLNRPPIRKAVPTEKAKESANPGDSDDPLRSKRDVRP